MRLCLLFLIDEIVFMQFVYVMNRNLTAKINKQCRSVYNA